MEVLDGQKGLLGLFWGLWRGIKGVFCGDSASRESCMFVGFSEDFGSGSQQ